MPKLLWKINVLVRKVLLVLRLGGGMENERCFVSSVNMEIQGFYQKMKNKRDLSRIFL